MPARRAARRWSRGLSPARRCPRVPPRESPGISGSCWRWPWPTWAGGPSKAWPCCCDHRGRRCRPGQWLHRSVTTAVAAASLRPVTGCGAVWLARRSGGPKVGSSNLPSPTPDPGVPPNQWRHCYNRNVFPRPPDPEYAEPFRAYLNYLEDLADRIISLYGSVEGLALGVHNGVEKHLQTRHIQRQPLAGPSLAAIEGAFRRSWATLRCLDLQVRDPNSFPEESNIWIPVQVYYAVYHAVLGFAASSGQYIPRDHTTALKLMSKEVKRGTLSSPWSAWCIGNPHTRDLQFGGLALSGDPVHVLSSPDKLTSDDRLAMLLRTTRQKELNRRFDEERKKKVKPGRKWRNLSTAEKEDIAKRMTPTTLFDVLWRIRKKASYEDADTFVLGAGDDAWRLARALVTVTDGTVAAIEALVAAYVGPRQLADISQTYADRTQSDQMSAIDRRAASWQDKLK